MAGITDQLVAKDWPPFSCTEHKLETSAGAGRFTELLLKQGAHVTSVDLSAAVEANQRNFPQGPRHRVAKADILRLPFLPQQYDVVFVLGVVQRLVRLLFPLHSRFRRYRKLLNRVSPVLTYHRAHPELTEEQQREWAFLDTHDRLTAWYRRHRTIGQVSRRLRELGAEVVWANRGGIGIEIRARRPDQPRRSGRFTHPEPAELA